MKPFAIVIHFDIFEYLMLGLGTGHEAFAMHCFDLEAMALTFHGGIVITVAFLTHTLWGTSAANQLMFPAKLLVDG
jgi:hypothetical protein